jgi:carbamoyl-phosphate synthase large subunit
VPIAKIATRIMLGETIDALKNVYQFDTDSLGRIFCCNGRTPLVAVKEAVFPFNRFSDVDTLLGPEMKSTGEVMGRGQNFTEAFSKSQIAAGDALPSQGIIIVTVADKYKQRTLPLARQLVGAGFELAATAGTADFLREHDVEVAIDVAKLSDKKSAHPNMRQLMQEKNVIFIINTPNGNSRARGDGYYTRKAALDAHIPAATSFAAARAITDALIKQPSISVQPLQNI